MSDHLAGLGLCAVVALPGPLAGRTGASRGHTESWGAPGVRVRGREPSPPARVGAVGGQYRDVCGRSIGGRGNRLVGSVLPANVWALASGTVTRGFFRHPRADRCTAKKGVRNRTCAHGGAGASASERLQNPPGSEPATPESRMIERKLKFMRRLRMSGVATSGNGAVALRIQMVVCGNEASKRLVPNG